jgi:hypothetical protein
MTKGSTSCISIFENEQFNKKLGNHRIMDFKIGGTGNSMCFSVPEVAKSGITQRYFHQITIYFY